MINYPVAISSDGGLAISTDSDISNVIALLDTLYYERAIFTNYGISAQVFDPVSQSDLSVLLLSLRLALSLWHSFVSDVQLDAGMSDDGVLQLSITLDGKQFSIEVSL